MEMFSNMLGLGTPKATPRKLDLPSNPQSETSSTSTSKAASRAESVIGSIHSLSRKLANAAENALIAAEQALATEEAEKRLDRKRREKEEWEALKDPRKKEDAAEEAQRLGKAEALTFPKPKPDKSPGTPTDDDLVELQRLETERMIAKLQKDQAEELARSSKEVPDGAVGGLPKLEKTHAATQTLPFLVLKKSEQHAKASISRSLTELSKQKKNSRYLEHFHAKIEEALVKLKEINGALLTQPGLSDPERKELEDSFYDYEQRVANGKNLATTYMTDLYKLEQDDPQGKQQGAKKKQPLPKDSPDVNKPKSSILKNVDKKKSSSLREDGKKKGKGSQDTYSKDIRRPQFSLEEDRRRSRELEEQIKRHAREEAEKYKRELQKKSQDAREADGAREWPDMGPALKASLEQQRATSMNLPAPNPAQSTYQPPYIAPPPGPSYYPGQIPQIPPPLQTSYQPPPRQYQYMPRDPNWTSGYETPRGPPREPPAETSRQPFTYPPATGAPGGFDRQETRYQPEPRPEYRQYSTEYVTNIPRQDNQPTPNPMSPEHRYLPPGIHNWTGEQGRTYNERPERPIIRIELTPFDGTPKSESWQRWKHNFGAVIGSKNYDDQTKCFQLLKALQGEPLRIAEALTMDSYSTEAYLEVWNTLEENYGGIYKLRNSIYSRIERFQKIKKFDKNNTLELENLLKAISSQFSNSRGIIDEGGVLNTQVKRLIPEFELSRYFLQVARDRTTDTLQEFHKFISEQRVAYKLADTHQKEDNARTLMTRTDLEAPVSYNDNVEEDQYESHAAYTPNSKPQSFRPRSDSTAAKPGPATDKVYQKNSETNTDKAPLKCSYCKEAHMLYACPTFKVLSVSSKYEHVKTSRSCIHCLNEGHMLRNCTFYPERKCMIDNCDRLHHRQLHNYRESNGRTLMTVEEFVEREHILASFTTGFGEAKDEYVAIRTTAAILTCNGKKRRVVVAMDPCSNSTNIDEDFAKEMGLRVEETGIVRNVNFLESSAKIESKIVSFVLSPIEGQAMYPVKAYTVRNLITGTPVVNWTKVAEDYPHLKKAQIPKTYESDRVHILLGTDFAYLNGSSQCISRGENEPIAERTKLGWAFSGRIKTRNILESWQSQFGNSSDFAFCSFMAKEDIVAPWKQSKSVLSVIHERIEDTQTLTLPEQGENLVALIDQKNKEDLVALIDQKNKEDSVALTKPEKEDIVITNPLRKRITAATLDLANLACICDPNPGLFVYLQIQPSVEEREKLHELDELVKRNWEIEALGLVEKIPLVSNNLDKQTSDNWTKSEKLAVEKMDVKYIPELKQFQMAIPWKDDPPKFMKSNRAEVKLRQDGVCKRLGDKIYAAQKIFDDYLTKGYIRKLSPQETYEQNVFYLPFFTVVKEDSTTPVRIVWDCAAKFFGRSLNSEIMPTPNCLQPLFTVLLRVRKFPFVVMSDISEMFLKVKLAPKDRRYHRFVFDGQDYEWTSILFGNRSSPDGSQLAIQLNCDMFGKELPEAVETVKRSLYMDDGADSRETEELALKLALELVELFSHCGMPVHKFFSNSDLVCQTLDKKTLAKQISFSDASDTVWDSGKVLGMIYSVEEGDVFTFSSKFRNVSELVDVKNGKWTKRNVCSASASIFDPLGLISPFVVRARVIMQEIWRQKIDWDQPLPEKIQDAWLEWLNQVFIVPDIKIKRWSGLKTKSSSYQIHTFCDASEEGYCVTVYIRVKQGKEITTNLLTAKSRVSPLKAESISRQELVACVLAVRLTSAVQETYPATTDNTFFWTDSEVCLVWINRTAKSFKAFVAHRVGEIHTHTEPRQWLHVPTAQNPADVGTRSITAAELKDCKLWWEGPEFLKLPIHEWPKTKVVQQIENMELKQTIFLTTEPFKKTMFKDSLENLHPRNFSVGRHYDGYIRCVRKWAMIQKAVAKFKNSLHSPRSREDLQVDINSTSSKPEERRLADINSAALKPEDIEQGKNFLIRQAQLEFFEQEIKLMSINYQALVQVAPRMKSEILQFNPFLDEFGVMRSRSRLVEVGRDFQSSHPVILHRQSDLTRLIAQSIHFKFDHPVSFAAMKAALRKHYAILGLGTLCSQIKSHCTECKKLRAGVAVQQMAPLPERRVGTQMRAFEHVGLDFAGPFELKVGRAKARKKVWILVLTCMVVRAVHFEVTGGLDTTCVINALSRFCDVRGIPETITSDNQASFHKADDELVEWYASIDWDRVVMETSFGFKPFSKGILWIFNPPLAPHFGGIFEIMVKAAKRALKATIGRADLDEEEFRTVVSKMAHLLNCRPIQLVSDRDDYETLTPNHFLLPGLAGAVFPPEVSDDDHLKLSVRLRHQIMVQQHVWKRFQAEIVPMLGPRKKWCVETENLKVDDVVMEIDDNLPRGVWRLLRVSKIIPSADGLVRKVEVINPTGKIYSRPISRLIPIARE